MATQIRPNRLEVSDRFPMLGFTVRSDGSAKRYEIAIGTAPDLFGPEGKSNRSRSNFYSTRTTGPLPIEHGESVYVFPPEVLARFVGQQKLYYGLAMIGNGSGGGEVVTMPSPGSPYINISGLTGRSLQRVRVLPSRQRAHSNYGRGGSEMEWAGDMASPGTQPAAVPSSKQAKPSASPAQSEPIHYDDGYGPLPTTPPEPHKQPQPQTKSLGDDIPLDPGVGGQSIGTEALQVGDIILSTTDHLTSTVIRAGTGSQVSHAMLFVGQGGQVVEAVGGGVRLVPLADAINDSTVAVAFRAPDLSDGQRQQIADSIAAYIGRPYDYVGVVRQGVFQIHKKLCAVLPDNARPNCENWYGHIDLGRGSDTDFYCSALVIKAFADAGAPLTSQPPNWSSPQDIAELALKDGALHYVGHLKAPIPKKSLLDVFGMSLADSTSEVHVGQKRDKHPHWRKHRTYVHAQGVLDWAAGHLSDLIREKFKSAHKTRYAFPAIRIISADQLQTLKTALSRGVMSSATSGIQTVLDKGYSVSIGLNAGAGASAGVGTGTGVVFGSDGQFGVYGELQVREGMFEEIAAEVKITIVKGGVGGFAGPTVSAGIELGAEFVGSIEALGDDTGNLLGIAVGLGGGEEIGAFFTEGAGWAVQLLGQSTNPAHTASAYALDAGVQPVQLPQATPVTGWKKQVIREALEVLVSAGMPPISTVLPLLIRLVNEQGFSIGLGLGGDAGLLGGAGLGFGVILAPNDDLGTFGSVEINAGLLAGLSGGARVIVIRGGIDAFNETGYALGVTVEEGPSISAIALFNEKREFHGVSFQLGVGAALSPLQIFTGVEKSVSSAVTQGLAANDEDSGREIEGTTPNHAAAAQSLARSGKQPQNPSQSSSISLPTAPGPSKKRSRAAALADASARMVGNSPINTVTGGEGNIAWELDQFPGVKSASQSVPPPMQSAETIELSNWPYCDHASGLRAAAWFNVDWKFSGQSLGELRITPAGTQQGGKPLRVEARIEDATSRDPNLAALAVRFTYQFSTANGPDAIAKTELKLYSDGSLDQNSNWVSQVAA